MLIRNVIVQIMDGLVDQGGSMALDLMDAGQRLFKIAHPTRASACRMRSNWAELR